MGAYAVLWLMLYAVTHWLPVTGWLPELEFEAPAGALSVSETEDGRLLVRSLVASPLRLRRGGASVFLDESGLDESGSGGSIVLLGGEAVEIDPPAEGAPPLVAFAVYGPAEIGRTLVLFPLGAADPVGFRPWQLITGPLFYPPSGGFPALMLGFLAFIFFAAPVERMLGVRSFFQLWFVASLSGAVLGLLLSALLPSPAAFGFAPAVFAVMVVHCMMTPEASVPFHLIFTVVHVRMKWIAAAIAGLVLLRTLGLMGGGPSGAYSLAGMIGGYLWWRSGADLDPRRLGLRRRARANLRLAVDRATSAPDEQTFH
jgi:membrane associated rhomboid family serine protease